MSIIRIADRGILGKERLHLKATADLSLSYYVVADTYYTTQSRFAGEALDVFWFTPKAIKAGDSIVLYTSEGSDSETKNTDGTTTHFYYWGRKKALWGDSKACAVVIELGSWVASPRE